jgi:hypothetical protein
MPKIKFDYCCPNCKHIGFLTAILPVKPMSIDSWCGICYYPISIDIKENATEIQGIGISKNAFLIHSSDKKDKDILDYLMVLLKLHGVETFVIEDDARSVDWLEKSLDGISNKDFVIAFLTKRYQYSDASGKITGWKAPDKCYEEIAIAFALRKKIIALVENDVDPGNVLKTRAWCYSFSRTDKQISPIDIEPHFLTQLRTLIGTKFAWISRDDPV